jgi:hypothetical protein
MTLLELQRKMAAAVLRPLTAGYTMQGETEDGRPMSTEAESFIKPNARSSSFERLEIYNQQYWFRVISALREDFPGLAAIVGEERFEALSIAYLIANPSSSYTLRDLGSRFEQWLRANPNWAGPNPELALDVARLEWAYVEAFDSRQEPALTLSDLSVLSADSQLALQPHIRLLELQYPVDDFVIAVHRAQANSSITSNAVTKRKQPRTMKKMVGLQPRKVYLAVHRFDFSVYYKHLEPEAFLLLEALARGASLGVALEEAFWDSVMVDADRANRVREWFATTAELGWFCQPAAHKNIEQ